MSSNLTGDTTGAEVRNLEYLPKPQLDAVVEFLGLLTSRLRSYPVDLSDEAILTVSDAAEAMYQLVVRTENKEDLEELSRFYADTMTRGSSREDLPIDLVITYVDYVFDEFEYQARANVDEQQLRQLIYFLRCLHRSVQAA